MIDDKTKRKFLRELEKSGNVFLSCLKVNIHRSTYYRWKESDKEFRYLANKTERQGRENICDIAKHALMLKVKEKDMRAIEYTLNHLDSSFKAKKTSNVVILHKKDIIPQVPQKTLEDLLDDENERRQALFNDTADSKFAKDMPTIIPPENQKISNNSDSNSSTQNNSPDNST